MNPFHYINKLPAWVRFSFVFAFVGLEGYGMVLLLSLSLFTYRSSPWAFLGTFYAGWLTAVALGGFLLYKLKLFDE